MLAIKLQGATHQIISCNIHQEKGKHQLWVERPNGKSLKVVESENKDEVLLVKEAIDYAISTREPMLEL